MLLIPMDTCGVCVTSIDGCTDSTATNYDPAATTDDGSCTYPAVLTITTTVCDGASSVMMTGPWWGWDPAAGPVAVDNGDVLGRLHLIQHQQEIWNTY